MSTVRKHLGNDGEKAVVEYLKNNGFTILKTNYFSKFGEIDIIAQKNDVVVFTEVKTRKNNYFNLSQVITPSKQKKIITTAHDYIVKQNLYNKVYRFDVALVQYDQKEPINYIKNAFQGSSFL